MALLPLMLAACSSGGDAPSSPAKEAEHIACAVGGSTEFKPVCEVERSRNKHGIVTLVVRHPDGAFRRFDVLDGGRGLALADGMDQAVTRYADGQAEIAIGTDRYRFPIKMPASGKTDAPH
jgi:hypothetical protein